MVHEVTAPVAAYFRLVRAAHTFLWLAVPFREPESRTELCRFIATARTLVVATTDRDAVLLQILMSLQSYTERLGVTLIERYLSGRRSGADCVTRCETVVNEALAHGTSVSPVLMRAIAVIETELSNPEFVASSIARRVGSSHSTVLREFLENTRLYPYEYLRQTRLNEAAALLLTTKLSVKEIWARVGYRNASVFDHVFKKRFGRTPSEYRNRGVQDAVSDWSDSLPTTRPQQRAVELRSVKKITSILVVDDDCETSDTIRRYLRLEGYTVRVSETGAGAIDEAERLRPDGILLDYHLPDLDGLECIRELRRRTIDTPVVVFSADPYLDDRSDELAKLGAITLFKLCELGDISRAIDSRLNRARDESRD